MENQSVTQTVISAATHRRHALAFNYASQALNNSFFLECLVRLDTLLVVPLSLLVWKQKPPSPLATNEDSLGALKADIRSQFGSLAQLQSTFSSAAMGMINSGWVWLVSDENGEMEIVGTFGAGTLLVRSRNHMLTDEKTPILGEPLRSRYRGPLTRPEDEPTPNRPTRPTRTTPTLSHNHPSATAPASGMHKSMPGPPSPQSRELHASPAAFQLDYTPNIYSDPKTISNSAGVVVEKDFDDVGDILTPLLCVSVQEHAWVGAGYGVWGKEESLKRVWTVVDWERVGRAYDKASSYR